MPYNFNIFVNKILTKNILVVKKNLYLRCKILRLVSPTVALYRSTTATLQHAWQSLGHFAPLRYVSMRTAIYHFSLSPLFEILND